MQCIYNNKRAKVSPKLPQPPLYIAFSERRLCVGLQIEGTLSFSVGEFTHNSSIVVAFIQLEVHPVEALHRNEGVGMHDRLGEELVRSAVTARL